MEVKIMEIIHNKLVRDNIPNIIQSKGQTAEYHILNDKDYKIELLKKLNEECNEVINSNNKEELLEELSDVLEVIKAIGNLENIELDEIINSAENKRLKKGGFDKKFYLEKTY